MKKYYILKLFILTVWLPGFSQENALGNTIFQVITNSEKTPEFEIHTDLDRLINDRVSEDYLDAELYVSHDNIEKSFPIEVQSRGKYRRRVCQFPPVRIKFSKKYLKSINLAKHNKLKLVTHCLDDKLYGNENVLKEYLAYQLYNALNPNSFEVKLVKIIYVDNKGNMPKIKRFGILIEDTDEMAERVGGEECEDCFNLNPVVISERDEARTALFQYLIGNEDWGLASARNIKLVTMPDGLHVPVPYDFDFSGLVNASYAIPRFEDLGLKSITERYYLGFVDRPEIVQETLQHFIAKKEELVDIVNGLKPLSMKERDRIVDYLYSFYDQQVELMNHLKDRQNELRKNETSGQSDVNKF